MEMCQDDLSKWSSQEISKSELIQSNLAPSDFKKSAHRKKFKLHTKTLIKDYSKFCLIGKLS